MATPSADERPGVVVRLGNWLFRWRNSVFPATFLLLVFLARPLYPGGSPSADVLMDWIGFALAAAGQALRATVIGLVYIRRGGKEGKVHADDLVTDGVFAHSRNPLYVGNFLVFLGLLTVLNSWAGWLIGLPAVILAYYSLVRAEEAFLTARFGSEYTEYTQRVNRFLPSWEGLGQTLGRHRFDWRRVIRKEYGSTFTWTTTMLLLVIWERIANGGWSAVRESWPIYAGIFGAIVALWGLARFLKKTRRLQLS